MAFDMSGLPELRFAPFSEREIDVIEWYQASEEFHPYTCCNRKIMKMSQSGLVCPDCGVIQDWILKSTFLLYKGGASERI